MARQVYHGLAARQKGQLLPLPGVALGDAAQKAPCLPGFAVQPVGQQHGGVARFAAGIRRSGAQFPHAAGDFGGHIVQRFGCFLLQKRRSRRGKL